MTHDSLCPLSYDPLDEFYCCSSCNPDQVPYWERQCACGIISIAKNRGWEQGIADAKEAIKSLPEESLKNECLVAIDWIP